MLLLLNCDRSVVYVGTIAGTIYASCVITTSVQLACVLTNVYLLPSLWLCPPAKACCGTENAAAVIATAATIAAIAKVVFL
jgi:hypothetical protein